MQIPAEFHTNYYLFFFFFNVPATTEIYTLSLHDALPISWLTYDGPRSLSGAGFLSHLICPPALCSRREHNADRKSTRLNSSHTVISYAVFCLKKKTVVTYNSVLISRTVRNVCA